MRFLPTKYYKSIYDIDYKKLKSEGIKCLVFDLDNTLASYEEETVSPKCYELIKKLKEDFLVLIITNNFEKRVKPYKEKLEIDSVSFAMKPLTTGLRRLTLKYKLNRNEIIMIGDQMVTDIYSASKFGIKSILVDPVGQKDLKITKINRIFEQKILNSYEKKGVFKRGNYYE
jgi:HAD superfamily phosphatase (TIGR01668 family)